MRIILLRPPRYVWPFNSETSAFWQPLGLLSLAATARRDIPEATVEVWDAPGERFGWRTLQRRLAAQRLDVLGECGGKHPCASVGLERFKLE